MTDINKYIDENYSKSILPPLKEFVATESMSRAFEED